MAENKEKGKSGAGKFFLGALIGAAAGAVAGRFLSSRAEKNDLDECECGDDCDCKKEEVAVEEKAEKATDTKKEAKKEKK
ncbi:MAG: hypothetical protein Q4A70_03640 [Candidatus Saccharibacteria bacterium]|nr:hypothetical protein [Candidatus Saccharibacteria bacterium]